MARTKNLPNSEPRLTVVDGGKYGIRSFGIDNGYPQRMMNLYNASGSANMCASLCTSYLIGKGFEDLFFYKAKINDNGLTPDKLLRRHAPDKSKLRGFATHFNYNGLYQKVEINYIPFEDIRIGVGENEGKFGVWKSWYTYPGQKKKSGEDEPIFIHSYNPDPLVIEEQVSEAGGWDNYKGQILYISDDFDSYPLASIDPVLDDVQAEIESSITRRNNLRNNFQLKGIWIEKGKTEGKREEEEVVENIREFMGPDGKPVLVAFSDDDTGEGKDAPEFKPFSSTLNDKLFQYTDQAARLAIYTQFGQPAVLHSDYLGASGFNEGQLPQSMEYYNSLTEPSRILFEEVYTEIFKGFHENVNPSGIYRIKPLEAIGNEIAIDKEDTRALIEIIGVGGTQALQSILADAATTPEQKKNTLVIVFGISEENASLLAGVSSGDIKTN